MWFTVRSSDEAVLLQVFLSGMLRKMHNDRGSGGLLVCAGHLRQFQAFSDFDIISNDFNRYKF